PNVLFYPKCSIYFNQDGYIKYCKDYREYWDWVAKRNEDRYQNNLEHGKNYDSKNMMHTFRLLDMAIEILEQGKVVVKRPNRAELLAIRNGEWTYGELIAKAERKMELVENAYQKSILPKEPNLERIKALLIELRVAFYR
ncbi:MAG: nucleotidyltransferase, partial [Bacteroidota bacterium]